MHTSNAGELPYFIKRSVNMDKAEKNVSYLKAIQQIDSVLSEEPADLIVKMVTINCLLKTHMPYFFWTGFYLVTGDRLSIGPYQGTLGCLYIEFGQGVCGTVAVVGETAIVEDVSKIENHVICDANSQSEIVVPVFDAAGKLIGVFDVDSTEKGSFDEVDQQFLEHIMKKHFGTTKSRKINGNKSGL
ncbi:MAG: GAF domain-containing protein [Bacteroidota bacterium]